MAGKKRRKRLISRKTELKIRIGFWVILFVGAGAYGIDRIIQSGMLEEKSEVEGTVMKPQPVDSTEALVESVVSEPESALVAAVDPDRDPTASNSSPLLNPEAVRVPKDEIVTTDVSCDWRLILVNPTHKLPNDFWVDTRELGGDETGMVDQRIYSKAMAMLTACEHAGYIPVVRGAYRTYQQQNELFQDKVQTLLNEGMTQEEAELAASTIIALPGTSEHELGLALDIVSSDNSVLNEAQENSPTQKWLMEHCWEYGFILRYPTDKCECTGIIYEPWHYRYVGEEAAKIIFDENLCLEEYLEKYGNGGRD